jgi:hypothetical protein
MLAGCPAILARASIDDGYLPRTVALRAQSLTWAAAA